MCIQGNPLTHRHTHPYNLEMLKDCIHSWENETIHLFLLGSPDFSVVHLMEFQSPVGQKDTGREFWSEGTIFCWINGWLVACLVVWLASFRTGWHQESIEIDNR